MPYTILYYLCTTYRYKQNFMLYTIYVLSLDRSRPVYTYIHLYNVPEGTNNKKQILNKQIEVVKL